MKEFFKEWVSIILFSVGILLTLVLLSLIGAALDHFVLEKYPTASFLVGTSALFLFATGVYAWRQTKRRAE